MSRPRATSPPTSTSSRNGSWLYASLVRGTRNINFSFQTPCGYRLRFAIFMRRLSSSANEQSKSFVEQVGSSEVMFSVLSSRRITYYMTGLHQFASAIWKPFESEFGFFTTALGNQRKELDAEINLAAEQAAFQERQLQVSHRQRAGLFSLRLEKESAENRGWRLQAEERKSSTDSLPCMFLICLLTYDPEKRKERLLNQLSSYNYLAALKQERKKRHGMTSSWLSQTSEWTEWAHSPLSSVFWFSGIREFTFQPCTVP